MELPIQHNQQEILFSESQIQKDQRLEIIEEEIELANSFIENTIDKKAKFNHMNESAFAFYRATAHLFYKDIKKSTISIPVDWKSNKKISTWLQGDLHLKNFGFFENDLGEVKFDINDFDESYIAPFYWDLIRFGVSLFLIQDLVKDFKLSLSEVKDVFEEFLEEYEDTLKSINKNSLKDSIELTESNLSGFLKDELRKAGKQTLSDLLKKWTIEKEDNRIFDFSNPDLMVMEESEKELITPKLNEYLEEISKSESIEKIQIKSMARRKNSGLGSLGVKKYYILLEGGFDSKEKEMILEIKQQKLPSLFLSEELSEPAYCERFSNHAERAKLAMKLLLLNSDNYSGVLDCGDTTYLVRKISKFKSSVDPKDFNKLDDLENFVKYCAKSIGYAHCRSDKDHKDSFLSHNFEKNTIEAIDEWKNFKKIMKEICESYAEIVKKDFENFQNLFKSGNLV